MPKKKTLFKGLRLTCSNNLLDFDTRDINLLSKLSHGLIRVFVSEWINVNFHSL